MPSWNIHQNAHTMLFVSPSGSDRFVRDAVHLQDALAKGKGTTSVVFARCFADET
jgi:hypothetical protein